MTTNSEHLQWILDRLHHQHGEKLNVDYMLRFQEIINEIQACEIMEAALKKGTAGMSPFQDAMLSMDVALNALSGAAVKFDKVQTDQAINPAERSMSMAFRKVCTEALRCFGLKPSPEGKQVLETDPYSSLGLNPED